MPTLLSVLSMEKHVTILPIDAHLVQASGADAHSNGKGLVGLHSSLESWPADILAHIFSYLTFADLVQLKKSASRRLTYRLSHEPILQTIILPKEEAQLSLPRMSFFGHTTDLTLNFLPRKQGFVHLEWLSSLPSSIERLDFDFAESAVIWIRLSTPGDPNWLFTHEFGYTPLFLCDLLPKLRRLRLTGSWNWPTPVAAPSFSPGAYKPQSKWTEPMKMMFIRKLPPSLETLEIDKLSWRCAMTVQLPPNLTRFTMHGGERSIWTASKGRDELLDFGFEEANQLSSTEIRLGFPNGLYNSLSHLTWSQTSFGELSGLVDMYFESPLPSGSLFLTPIRFFPNLTSLDLLDANLLPTQIALLPRSLSTLAFSCVPKGSVLFVSKTLHSLFIDIPVKSPLIEPRHFVQLPQHLTSLTIEELSSATWQAQTDCGFLPPSLTKLELTKLQGVWRADIAFASLKLHCTSLRSLTLKEAIEQTTEQSSIQISSFAWLPEHLFSLTLSTVPLIDSAFASWPKPTRDDQDPSITISSPAYPPFKLHLLHQTGTLLTDDVCPNLPPGLTELLICSGPKLTPKFLDRCPRSLILLNFSHLGHYRKYSNATRSIDWSDEDLLSVNLPPHFTRLSQITASMKVGVSFSKEMKTLSMEELYNEWSRGGRVKQLLNAAEGIVLRNSLTAAYPSSLTCIDIPTFVIDDLSPIWMCPSLETIKVESLRSIKFGQNFPANPPSIKTLHFSSPSKMDWLVWKPFRTLTDLKMVVQNANPDTQDLLRAHLKAFPLLCFHIEWSFNFTEKASYLKALVESIPRTVKHLTMAIDKDWINHDATSIMDLKLVSFKVPRNQFIVKASDLKEMSPHLTELSVSCVEFENLDQLVSRLPDNTQSISLQDLVRLVCPSIINYIRPSDMKEDQIGWTRSAQELTLFPTKHTGDRVSSLISSLPRSLKHWAFWLSGELWLPQFEPLLPPTLTSLDLSRSAISAKHRFNLPDTLTSLSLVRSSWYDGPMNPDLFASLPRSLLRLSYRWFQLMDTSHPSQLLKGLPEGLTELRMSGFGVQEPQLLPKSLRTLVIYSLPSVTTSLPETLTWLECERIPLTWISELMKLPNLTRLVGQENAVSNGPFEAVTTGVREALARL